MSLILDALRKIEQERRTRRQESIDIRADVLNYHGRMPPARKSRPFVLLGLTLVFAAGALTFIYRQQSPTVAADTAAPAEAIGRPDVQPAVVIPPPPSAEQANPAPKQEAAPTVAAQRPATVAVDSGESMVISGIAWQEDRSLRRAVINGVLAGEGAEILGARILEIREDRVIFSRNNRAFEVNYAGGAGR